MEQITVELVRSGIVDLTGRRFGRLVVLGYAGSAGKSSAGNSGTKGAAWMCKCDCGRSKVIRRSRLLTDQTKSCGCLANTVGQPRYDLVGQRFGRLVVTEYAGNDKRRRSSQWKCMCDCGDERLVTRKYLKCGFATSCGCRNRGAVRSDKVVSNVQLVDAAPKFRACEPGIYCLFYKGEIVYIGQSRNVFERVAGHERRGLMVFDYWDFARIEDAGVRCSAEQQLIRQHQPKYNGEGASRGSTSALP